MPSQSTAGYSEIPARLKACEAKLQRHPHLTFLGELYKNVTDKIHELREDLDPPSNLNPGGRVHWRQAEKRRRLEGMDRLEEEVDKLIVESHDELLHRHTEIMTRSQLQIVDAVPQLSSEMMGAAAHVLEKGGAVVLKELSLYELATFTEGRKHDAERRIASASIFCSNRFRLGFTLLLLLGQSLSGRIVRLAPIRFAEIRSRSPSTLPRTMGFHWWAEIILVDCPGGLLAATSDSAEETIAEARPRMGFEGCGSRDRRKKDRRKDVAD